MSRGLRQHWPEYLIEAWALGTFMMSAALFTALLEHPASPVNPLVPNGAIRRALTGLAMGITAVALIYSPWGQRSGAHMNPATTSFETPLGCQGHAAHTDSAHSAGSNFGGTSKPARTLPGP